MLTQEVDVVALYKRGVPIAKIKRRCGESAKWIYRQLRAAGVQPSRDPRHYCDVTLDPGTREVQRYWFIHGTIRGVVRALGRHHTYVIRRLPPEVARPKRKKKKKPILNRNMVTGHERMRMFAMKQCGIPIPEIARRLGRCPSTIFDHLTGRRNNKRPAERIRWPRPFETAQEAYRDLRYEDVPVKIGPLGNAIIAGRKLRHRSWSAIQTE